jgi:hypothetical protein
LVRDRRHPKPPKQSGGKKIVRWPGEADPKQFHAKTDDGVPTPADRAIVPIAQQFPDKTWALVGTGFFICTHGLVATAGHVAKAAINLERMKQTSALGVFQFLGGNQVVIRPVARGSWHTHADVAVLVLAEMKHNVTGAVLTNPVIGMTAKPVSIGHRVFTCAYPRSKFEGKVFRVQASYFDGHVQEFLPSGRDQTFLPSACYRTSMHIHGGASGGPVFGADGKVFGINSTGWDGTDLSYISRVNELLPLELHGIQLAGDSPRPITIAELIARGHIQMEGAGV